MRFWTSGRIDEKIAFEIFQPVMLEVERQINNIAQDKNYGNEIISYDVVVNIFEDKSEERFKYSPKNRETDIDVNIEHDVFLNGDFNKRCKLYLNAILQSLDGIKANKHLRKFDFTSFSHDISSLIDKYNLPAE
jgi:hypothetical protein